MGYLNNVVGYRKELLTNRSVVKKGSYALLTPDGLVKNVIPGFENCDITIFSSPKLGASFVDYLVTIYAEGKNELGFGADGVETLFYLLEGSLVVKAGEQTYSLDKGGYVYCPPGTKLYFYNESGQEAKAFLYKRVYTWLEGYKPYVVAGNTEALEWTNYEGMEDVLIKDFLPKDIAFDCNFHILSFKPGASHGYVETHIQEHGAYCLSGQGMYNLDNDWVPVQKDDYIFMGAYCLQACYAVGRDEDFAYVYSKDCNRDVIL
ncbi:(S)-ureidoglycine aminohydrolase [Sporomusaceae bacterium BoRhaA]|uniref:(S)-ureidoglycine aminohydrolase n=1 Tax=Pelorhabdus rhamnosifermentans TaxID=2772457 RepID=UPI001C05EDDE|nr:(S)-ureidoglycine aminohydrolase [Pelorhabdus rhamnosifermentans]MBU2702479.1 (S)-ureidoglycine aminohydrolase [Pelorhabdus rhamnosifermentans]